MNKNDIAHWCHARIGRWFGALVSWRLPRNLFAPALVLAALIETTGCGGTQTGVWQLPVPPNRPEASFTGAAPQVGPSPAPLNECKGSYGEPGGPNTPAYTPGTYAPGTYAPGSGVYGRYWGNYRLGTGDKIRVVVLQDSEFSGDYEVDQTGHVSARMLGPTRVAGMTIDEVQNMLRDSYRSSGYLVSPRISVELVSARPFYILGEATRNGSFPYVACLRVIQAVAIAGGFTRRAARTRMTIRRFYSAAAEEELVTEDTLVEPGDVLRIPERWF